MEPSEYPPNSEASKRQIGEKDIHRVTSGDVVRKKRSLRKQLAETLFAGDFQGTLRYVLFEIAIESGKDLILEIIQGGSEKLIRGDSRRRGHPAPPHGPTGYVSYNRMGPSRAPSAQRAMSRMSRSRHDFDEIILESRTEAEEVIDRLFDLVSRYDTATVADLYELVGLASTHADHKWGWTDVRGAGVTRSRDGYLLDLPDPHPL